MSKFRLNRVLPVYRDHGDVLCYNCGRAGVESGDNCEPGKFFLGVCHQCGHWTAYEINPEALAVGDIVFVVDKNINPDAGVYTKLEDTGWDVADMGWVLKFTSGGGVMVANGVGRLGVFNSNDLSLITYHETLLKTLMDEVEMLLCPHTPKVKEYVWDTAKGGWDAVPPDEEHLLIGNDPTVKPKPSRLSEWFWRLPKWLLWWR